MKNVKMLMGGAFALVLAAAGSAHAQTVAFNAIGSSALFLAAGQAAATSSGTGAVGASCVWSHGSSFIQATDPTTSSLTTPSKETGSVWIAWEPSSDLADCQSGDFSTSKVYSYLQTDSVVGNRCLANGCTIGAVSSTSNPTNTTAAGNLISGVTEQTSVPSAIWTALNGHAVNVAGTDIRPEDAQFAINRALTSCGSAVSSANTNYLGLGYISGDAILTAVSGSTSNFRVISFTLPSSYTVTTVGATPVVVAAVGSDFSGISNVSSGDLAKLLSGTYTGTSLPQASTVLIREPLSGTYNTMEYNIPNTQNGTNPYLSQDVGFNQPAAQRNCNGSVPQIQTNLSPTDSTRHNYQLSITTAGGGVRSRTIGTGQELSTLFNVASGDRVGYSFWSAANFAGATTNSTSKYLKVDNVDPLKATYDGVIPTTSTQLGNVTLQNVANGTYPIWSNIRLVNAGSTALSAVTAIATAAQNFAAVGKSTTHPDFVAKANLAAVHSHFTPPGVTVATVSNGSGVLTGASACSTTEGGGDVGGQIFTATSEQTVCSAGQTTGNINARK